MAKKSLQELNTQELSKILDEFGQKQVIFQSEAQFQFELAWRLQEFFDCKAKLEELTMVIPKPTKTGNTIQKIYTDIVLEKNDYRVAIELKYKTALLNMEPEVLLLYHGAPDLGRYDFLWDVKRVETLVTQPQDERIRRHCNKGFAVILTNDDDYWQFTFSNCKTDAMYKQFCIGEDDDSGHGQLCSNYHDWRRDDKGTLPKSIAGTVRAQKIDLKRAYEYEWKKYANIEKAKNGLFRYMIISVQ